MKIPNCIICEEPMKPVWEDMETPQPNDGIMCSSSGNYGSAVLDAVFGEPEIVFIICDLCLISKAERGFILTAKKNTRVTWKYGAYEVTPYTKLWVESETHEEYEQKLRENGLTTDE